MIQGILRLQAGRLTERRLGIFQQVHLQTYPAEAQQNRRVLWLKFLGAEPVRERALQFAPALGDGGGLSQRRQRLRIQAERLVIAVKRTDEIVLQRISACQVED